MNRNNNNLENMKKSIKDFAKKLLGQKEQKNC